MKTQKFRRSHIAVAAMLALASPFALESAFAGAGWADNTDKAGIPFKQATFFANSPSGLLPDHSPGAANGQLRDSGAPIRKFIDPLPLLGQGYGDPSGNLRAANPVGPTGRQIPVALKEATKTYGNDDYYEIAVVEYREQLHSDLPPVVKTVNAATGGTVTTGGSMIRGYVQIWTPNLPTTDALGNPVGKTQLWYLDGKPVLDNKGQIVYAVGDGAHFLGPIIDSQSGVAVRIKFNNYLPTGHFDPITKTRGGDSFVPTDHTVPGAGLGPNGAVDPAKPTPLDMYTQNRALIHLHGGDTPWISDGQPHSWITPAGENTQYPRGETTQNVPDMADPGPGAQTYYFPNRQSARMMWYHDHSYAATRLNVYSGQVSAFMLHDSTEAALQAAGALPADEIPLVFEDRTFVPKDIAIQDSKWNTNAWGNYGDFFYPHVYEVNQNPNSIDGTNPAGRFDYGPWFWPVFPAPLALPAGDYDEVNGISRASGLQEAFADTPVINGVAYPDLKVEPKPYRFRLLNASGQRYLNLGLYVAEPLSIGVSGGGAGYSPLTTVSFSGGGATTQATGHVVIDTTTTDPVTGLPINSIAAVIIDNPGSGYTSTPTVTITDGSGTGSGASFIVSINTEVPMVAAVQPPANAAYGVNTYDGRPGGIPDPAAAGPNIIHIGTEGGFLAQPNVIPSTPVSYQQLRRIVTVLNVLDHGLYVGPAERADFVVDFSQFAGKTLIAYNDAPAPNPGFDARVDYYTGNVDYTGSGGADTTMPGYGPNTRTIMRINVAPTLAGGAAAPAAFDPAGKGGPLASALPAAFAASQVKPTVPEAWQNAAYGTSYSDNLGRIYAGTAQQSTFSFSTGDTAQSVTSVTLDSQGVGYTELPQVSFEGGFPAQYIDAATGLLNAAGTAAGLQMATAHAILDRAGNRIAAVALDSPGVGYTSAPIINIWGGNGIGAAATALTTAGVTTVHVQSKGIQELFEPNYGRMNATFSAELPFTAVLTQTTIPLGYIDPPTEAIADGETQFWKITHNGVDTHTVHFHLFNVQVINRVGWDGTVVALDPAEFGWKETVKMNPLEDIYIAVKPKSPAAPFGVPQSIRALDPTQALGAAGGFSQVDPTTGLATTVVNEMHNFDWEYIWHCHILGHEENDFMRVISFNFGAVAPDPVVIDPNSNTTGTVTWTDNTPAADILTPGNKKNEIGFIVQRSDATPPVYGALPAAIPQSAAQATQNPANVLPASVGVVVAANQTTWVDPTPVTPTTSYQVVAFNSSGYSTGYANIAYNNGGAGGAGAGGNSTQGTISNFTASVGAFDPLAVQPPQPNAGAQPLGGFPVTLSWTSPTLPSTGFSIVRSGGVNQLAAALADVTFTVPSNATTFIDPAAPQTSAFTYKIYAVNGATQSAATQVVVNTNYAPPPDMGPLTVGTVPAGVALSWDAPASTAYLTAYKISRVNVATGETVVFQIQQSINVLSAVVTPPATAYTDITADPSQTYQYTVVAMNGPLMGTSATAVTTVANTPALAPALTGLFANAPLPNQITLSWAPPPSGSFATGFTVTRSSGGGAPVALTVPAGLATSFTDLGVADNTTYTYTVQWFNGSKANVGASAVTSVTTPFLPAGAVNSLVSVGTPTQVTLTWAKSNPATGYIVSRCEETALNANCTGPSTVFTVISGLSPLAATTLSFLDAAVVSNTAYTYQVVSVNGPVSNVSAAATTKAATINLPAAPTLPTIIAINSGAITVGWTPVAATSTTTAYQVQRSADGGNTWVNVAQVPGQTAASVVDYGPFNTGITYTYRVYGVAVIRGVTELSALPSGTVAAPYIVPNAPLMAATTFSGTQAVPGIVLHWSPTLNAGTAPTSYQIFRNGAILVSVNAVGNGAQAYTDTTGLVAGNTYSYQVVAVNPVGNSAVSTVSVSLLPQAAPGLASATLVSGTQADLVWTQTVDATLPPVIGYQVYASINGAADVAIGPVLAGSAVGVSQTIAAGNSYSFTVKALSVGGTSLSSNALALVDVVQPAPVESAVVVNSGTSASLNWAAPVGAVAGAAPVTGYNVYNGATKLNATPLAANVTTYNAATVLGSTYNFSVTAVSVSGESLNSNVQVLANIAPNAATQTAAVVNGPTSITLNWAPAAAVANAPAVSSYNIYNGATLVGSAAANATSFDAAAVAGTTYNFSITSLNASGESAKSNVVVVADVVPNAPVQTAATVNGPSSTTLHWAATAAIANAPVASGYNIYDGSTLIGTAPANANAFTVATVAGTTYNFSVSTVNATGVSAKSNVVVVADLAPNAPTQLAAIVNGPASTTVRWTPAAAVPNAPAVTGYNVYNGGVLVASAAANATSLNVATVLGNTYNFTVTTLNIAGESTPSNAVVVADVVPNAPSITTATVNGPTSVTLNWAGAAAIANAPATTGYKVYNGAVLVGTLAANVTTLNVVTVLGTTYNFSVTTLNVSGESAASAVVTVADVVPNAATQSAIVVNSATSSTLNWVPAAAVANAPAVTGYNVYNGTTKLNATPLAANATSYNATTALNGNYNFSVSTLNIAGESAKSNAIVLANVVPTAPVQTAAVVNGPNSTTVNWTPSAPVLNGPPVTGYNVYYNNNLQTPTPLAANVTSWNMVTTAATTYNFTVRAVDAVGVSAVSNQVTVVNNVPAIPTTTAPSAAQIVRNAPTTTSTTDTVTLPWTPVATVANGQAVTQYVIEYASTNTFATILDSKTVAGTVTGAQTAVFSLVNRGTAAATPTLQGFFRVRATNIVGTSTSATRTVTLR